MPQSKFVQYAKEAVKEHPELFESLKKYEKIMPSKQKIKKS